MTRSLLVKLRQKLRQGRIIRGHEPARIPAIELRDNRAARFVFRVREVFRVSIDQFVEVVAEPNLLPLVVEIPGMLAGLPLHAPTQLPHVAGSALPGHCGAPILTFAAEPSPAAPGPQPSDRATPAASSPRAGRR